VSTEDIERINLESLKHRSIEGLFQERTQIADALSGILFHEKKLPVNSILLDPFVHARHIDYLQSRCVPMDYPFLVHENITTWNRPHIIIPFTYKDIIVGHTYRFLDNTIPKYINSMQPGYVFGTDLQKSEWQYAIVSEGIFDALCINGLAVMHNTINDTQVRLIKNLGKEIIVVPDQDIAGIELVDRALELGWAVSIPDWPRDIKDINDCVKKMGKLATILTILRAKETSKIKIELRKRQLVKRLRN
jgi:nitrogen fixation protein